MAVRAQEQQLARSERSEPQLAKPRATYSVIVRREGPPNKRAVPKCTTGADIERTTSDETQRRKLGSGVFAWRKRAPTGHTILRGEVQPRERPLRHK